VTSRVHMKIFAWVVLAAGLLFLGYGLQLQADAFTNTARAGGLASSNQLAAGVARGQQALAVGVPVTIVGALLVVVATVQELGRTLLSRLPTPGGVRPPDTTQPS
jgi:hypothetical protein